MKNIHDCTGDIWGPRTPYRPEWPVRVDCKVDGIPDHAHPFGDQAGATLSTP